MGSGLVSAKVMVSVRESALDSVSARVRMASALASVWETPLAPVAYS